MEHALIKTLRAPFPYYGHKGRVASYVWERLGNPPNYVEPFAGSLAVLLQRPNGHSRKREVVNDTSGGLCNFWRAVKYDPDAVATHAIHPCSESDLHARNAYCREKLPEMTARLEGDPEFYDAKLAGWWVYVQCLAIGEAAYARGPWIRDNDRLVCRPRSNGVRRAIPCDSDRGIQKSIPFHGKQGLMTRTDHAVKWLQRLRDRLRDVRILCGDWSRAVKPTYTSQHGLTGVFLDPPYDCENYRFYRDDSNLYVSLCEWCLEAGRNKGFRIALCGYADTLPVDLESHGWDEYAWTAQGGRVTPGADSDRNRHRERIWFSPHCCRPEIEGQIELFGGVNE